MKKCYRCKRERDEMHFPVRPDGSLREICLVCFAMIPRNAPPMSLTELRTYSSRWTRRADEASSRLRMRSLLEESLKRELPTDTESLEDIQEPKARDQGPGKARDVGPSKQEPTALDILEKGRKK